MQFYDWVKLVTGSVRYNPVRSFLTATGIAIGIFAVALLTSIGEGVRSYVAEHFAQFGTNIVAITPGKTETMGMTGMLSTVKPLTIDDAEALRRLPHVDYTVPVVAGVGRIESHNRARSTDVYGVGYQMPDLWKYEVAIGRFFPNDPPESARPYAVLGSKLKKELFGNTNPLGEFVRITDTRFRVIGVMEHKGMMLGLDIDDAIYIPTNRALQLFNREGVMEIDLVFDATTSSEQMKHAMIKLMIDRHGREDFTVITQDQALETLDNILSVLTLAVGALGSISLFVGGVGILTIMTTAVRERRREVGLLRAVGSTQRQILLLFLGEAMVLAMLGGFVGLVIMVMLGLLITVVVPGLPLQLNPVYLMSALILSGLIGVIAGVAPARQAARLDPIEALRA